MPQDNDVYIGSPDNPRTAGAISYITFIGWLISYFALYKNNKTEFTSFHLRQSLLIHIFSFILKALYSFSIWSALFWDGFIAVLAAILFVIWLIGFVNALNGKMRQVPLLGKWAQAMFSSL